MAADGGDRGRTAPYFELLEDRIVLDAVPDVDIGLPAAVPIGAQDVELTLTFDNTGTDSGYVPYIDLILPTTGEDGDDGVTFDSATFLGVAIDTTVLTFDADGEVEHPFAVDALGDPFIVSGTPGDTLVVLELPYGSFSPGNPAVDVDVVLDFSDLADLDQSLDIQAIGGFALGEDPLDNPTTDAPIRAPAQTESVDLTLFSVSKANNIPEADAVSGPSYPYQYTLSVDVADGQTLTDFTLTDTLPPEIVYLGNLSISGAAGSVVTEPPEDVLVTAPDNQLVVDFASISGPVSVTFDFYVNETSSATSGPVIAPASGDEAPVTNSVVGEGTWDPLDGRDPVEMISDSATDIIQARSIAVQKGNAVVTDNQAPGVSPGDRYEFTLNLQVSDYFTFGDLLVTDVLGNGWEYVAGSAEFTFVETGGGSATPTSLTAFETSNFVGATGETTNIWDLSAALQSVGDDGLLTGFAAGGGTGAGSQTTIQITYQADIRTQYPAGVPGDQEIGQGDELSNDARVDASVRDNAVPGTTIGTEDDTTSSGVTLISGVIGDKTVFAVNGNVNFDTAEPIAAGDEITFSVIYDGPLGSFEDLVIADFLPQNVFSAAEVTVFNDVQSGTPPAAGEAQYGSTDQYRAAGGTIPGLIIDAPNNGVTFDFGDFSADPRTPVSIEILFTVTVEDAVFAPELLLTNQATAFETDSFGNTIDTTSIAQFTYSEPLLEITKGVIAFESPDADTSLSGPAGPVTFTDPGTGGARFSGTISSDGLDSTPIDADISNIDAGDLVSFAIVIENTGRAPNGAFNVTIADTLPAGFEIPPGGLNLSITDGAGNVVAVDTGTPEADLFAGGITLTDGATEGAISAFDPTAGDNIIIVTYDLLVQDSVTADETITNTAAVTEYNAIEGGGGVIPVNRVPTGGLDDTADATIENVAIEKTLETREFAEGGRNEVLVGESFTYIIAVDLVEGTFDNAVIEDIVTSGGLELIDAQIITYDAASISNTSVSGLGLNSIVTATGGDTITFDFGTLTVLDDNDESNDVIEIRVNARAPDDLVGAAGEVLVNRADFDWDGGRVRDFNGQRLAEPNMTMDKGASPSVVQAGGTVGYNVDISNIQGSRDAPAFDLRLEDTLDPNLTLDTGSIVVRLDGTDVTNTAGYTVNLLGGNSFEVIVDVLNEGEDLSVTYEGTVDPGVPAGLVIPNTAELTFDSTPEDEGIGAGAGDDSDDRDYSLTADAEVSTALAGLSKTVVATSNPDTSGTDLAISEEVTYEIVITVPEGNTLDLLLEDVLPSGAAGELQYVSSQIISIGNNISGASLPAVSSSGTNVGDTTTFSFGDVSNVVDLTQDADDEIVVQITAVVLDLVANEAGDVLVNTATVSEDDPNLPGTERLSTSDTAEVTVVEPSLDIDKSVTPAVVDAGDVVTYTLLSTNSGGGPAYDILIDDTLADAGIDALPSGTLTIRILDGATDVTPGGADTPTVTFNAGALQASIPELGAGQTIEIVYQATVTDAALFASPIPNTAEVTRYDSDPAGGPADANGRVYDAGLAGYVVPSDSAEVDTPQATLTKSFTDTSDANTAGDDVGVGEVVTYELVITLPQGTADLTLTDVLPDGLSAQSATFVRIDNDPGVSSDIAVGSSQTGVGTTDNITINAAGDSVVFDFGTVVVTGEDDAAATDTQIVVQITALVEDVVAVADGATLINNATLEVVDPAAPGTDLQPDVTATETVEVVEPEVLIQKSSPAGADPGDTVPYTITLINTGTGPAYDLELTDTLADPNLSLVSGTVDVFLNGVLAAPQPTVTETVPDGFVASGITVLPGDTVEVRFDVLLDAAAPEAQSFPNTATAVFDTVEDGDPNSPTGRTDTISDDNALATVPRIEKTPFTTDIAQTDSELGDFPFEVAVGEQVTYRYEMTFPEIEMSSVVVEDALPLGMEYVSSSIISSGFAYTGTVDVTVAANQRDVTFDFGAITNPSDGSIGADDVLVFEVVARVVDDAAASAGETLTNTVDLTVTPQGEPALATQSSSADIVVVEPLLTIDKTAPLAVARGADADFTISVVNEGAPGAEGPAFDVVIGDTLDPDFTLNAGSIEVRLDGVLITPVVTTGANTFSLEVPVVDVDQTVTVTYSATLDADAAPAVFYGNTATADYTSAPGATPDERSYAQVTDSEEVATDPILTKTAISGNDPLTGSAEHDPTQLDLTIGEEVTFELVLTLPEIPLDSVTLTDTLPAGYGFVSASIDSVGAGITFASSAITDSGQTVTYSFTDLVNPSDGSIGADDEITVLLTAVVLPDASIVDGAEVTNTATLAIVADGGIALNPVEATATVDIVEPELTIDKTGSVAVAPGETVSYTATLTNTGTAPAQDVFVTDTLGNPFLTLQTGSVTAVLDGVDVTGLITITETATGFEFLLFDAGTPATLPIEVGDSLVVTYLATLDVAAPEAQSFVNTISADYDTIGDGDPNSPDSRTTTSSDDHAVATVPFIDKRPFTSSNSDTDSEVGDTPFELAIGETVTYRYEIYLPEIDMDSVFVEDTLPDGLTYQSFSVVNFGVPAMTDTDDAPLADPIVNVSGQTITFDFGDVRNNFDGSIGTDDVITFDVTALVTDVGTNAAGVVLTNTVQLDVDPTNDDPFSTRINTADVQIVEPELTVEKSGDLVVEPGGTANYLLTIENTGPGGENAGPAYDVEIADSFPPEIALDPLSLEFRVNNVVVTPTLTADATGFSATLPVLQANEVLTVTYTGTVSAAAVPPESFENTVTVDYDSAPGDDPNERVYAQETDDHRVATPPTLDKTILSTSVAATGDGQYDTDTPDVNIGEEITYELVITLPEIPTDGVTLTDTLPTGLSFVSADIVSVGSEITGVTAADEATVVSANGQIVTFDFGAIENLYSDGVIDGNDEIVVTVTARVDDIGTVVDGTVLSNNASLVLTPEGEAELAPVTDSTSVEVVEPDVDIVKAVSDTEPSQGDIITYTVTVSNDPTATGPALNVVVTDPLPQDLSLTGSVSTSGAGASVTSSSGSTLVVSIPVLQPGETVTITYDAFVGYATPVFTDVINTATVTGGTSGDPNDPGREFTDDDTEVIEVEPVPAPAFEEPTRLVGGGIDDAQFLPVLLIDPIFTGTAEYGSNVTINLYQLDGSLSYVRNIVADAGGHWIAIFPRVSLIDVDDDFHQRYQNSVLFSEPVKYLDNKVSFDGLGATQAARTFFVGTQLEDDSYTVRVDQDRPSTLPEDRGMFNARVFFSPATIGEAYQRGDVLDVDDVFQDFAGLSVRQLYEATVDPLAVGLNRFNYEFLSDQTALPGSSAN